MATQNSEEILAKYNCTQAELYSVTDTVADSYTVEKDRFKLQSSLYTDTTGTALKAEVELARLMPDSDRRLAAHALLRIELAQLSVNCLIKWQDLSSYIRDGFSAAQYESELTLAGRAHYAAAQNENWEEVRMLMTEGAEFIAANMAALTTGGMVTGFTTGYDTALDQFIAKKDAFIAAEESGELGTEEKLAANNVLYAKVIRICEDGRKIFRESAKKRKQFTFEQVLDLIRTSTQTHTVSGTLTQSSDGSAVVNGKLLLAELLPTGEYADPVEARTDLNGHYKYMGLHNGRYRLMAGGDGLATETRGLEVNDGPVVEDFVLNGI